MNILFLDSIEAEIYGGMEEWIRLVASGLRARGHNVTVAGRRGSEFLRRTGESAKGVEPLPLDISGDFQPFTIAAIKRHLDDRQIDIVVVNFNKDVRLGGLAAKLRGETRVVWSLGLDITSDSLAHRIITPMLIDGIIVPSHSLKSQIIRHGYLDPGMVEVIPIGIPDISPEITRAAARIQVCAKYGLSEDAILGVTVGRFVEQKGHKFLLSALADIVKRCPGIRLVWLGSGPLENELRKQAAELGVESYVVFVGMLDSVEQELAASDFMIHPSVEEPFGIAVLEGMRAGLPVVASRVGGLTEVLDDSCALFVEPRDSVALSHSVLQLLSDFGRMREMGQTGRRRFLEHFRLNDMYIHIEQYLTAVMQAEHHDGKA